VEASTYGGPHTCSINSTVQAWPSPAASRTLTGITRARIAGTASRYVSREPLDVDAAVAELREIADGRGDLLAERAGVILAFHDENARDGRWPRRALEAALCIAAGADLTRLMEWIAVGQERAQRIR
jgi:hypothetical protein